MFGSLLLVITVINHHNSRFFKHFVRISEPLKSAQKGFGDLFSVFFSSACTNLDHHCEHFEFYLNISSIIIFTLILCNIFIFLFCFNFKKVDSHSKQNFNTHLSIIVLRQNYARSAKMLNLRDQI